MTKKMVILGGITLLGAGALAMQKKKLKPVMIEEEQNNPYSSDELPDTEYFEVEKPLYQELLKIQESKNKDIIEEAPVTKPLFMEVIGALRSQGQIIATVRIRSNLGGNQGRANGVMRMGDENHWRTKKQFTIEPMQDTITSLIMPEWVLGGKSPAVFRVSFDGFGIPEIVKGVVF